MDPKTKKGYLMIAGTVLFFIVVVILSSVLSKEDNIDKNLCLKDKPLEAHTAVLIDMTILFTQDETTFLKDKIQEIQHVLRQNDLFSIYSINKSQDTQITPKQLFSRCRPKSGKEANPIYESPDNIQKKYEKDFVKPVKKLLTELPNEKNEGNVNSPIIEAIQGMTHLANFSNKIKDRRLIVISNMLEKSSILSHYNNNYTFEKFKSSEEYSKIKSNLEGIDINIYYMVRPNTKSYQCSKHISFWRDFFTESGAKSLNFYQVDGKSVAELGDIIQPTTNCGPMQKRDDEKQDGGGIKKPSDDGKANRGSFPTIPTIPNMTRIEAKSYHVTDNLKNYLRENIINIRNPFYIQDGEVTVGDFRKYVKTLSEENKRKLDDEWEKDEHGNLYPDKKPVEHISWDMANSYARWKSLYEKHNFSIPTLEQWAAAVILHSEHNPVLKISEIPMAKLRWQPDHLLGNLREWSLERCGDGAYRLLGESDNINLSSSNNCTKGDWRGKGVGFRLVRNDITN